MAPKFKLECCNVDNCDIGRIHSHCDENGCDYVFESSTLTEIDNVECNDCGYTRCVSGDTDIVPYHKHCNKCKRTDFHIHCHIKDCKVDSLHIHCNKCTFTSKDYYCNHFHCDKCDFVSNLSYHGHKHCDVWRCKWVGLKSEFHVHCIKCKRTDSHSHCVICNKTHLVSEYHNHCIACDRTDRHRHCLKCKKDITKEIMKKIEHKC